jgi:hypothetical protein
MAGGALGYKILYGPPMQSPEVLFIGNQPGGQVADAIAGELRGERSRWPDIFEYASEPWRLATAARRVWQADILARSTGLNLCFFRSPSVGAWRALPSEVIRRAETFSLERSRTIVDMLRPKAIVVIGLVDFAKLARADGLTTRRALSNGGRDLVRTGQLWGHSSAGTIHLSGARISTLDMKNIAQFFENYLAELATAP